MKAPLCWPFLVEDPHGQVYLMGIIYHSLHRKPFSPILALGASCGTGLSPRSAMIFLPCPMITVLVIPPGTKLRSRVRSTTRVLPCWPSSWLMSSHPPSPQPTAHLVTILWWANPSPSSPFPSSTSCRESVITSSQQTFHAEHISNGFLFTPRLAMIRQEAHLLGN